MVHFKVLALNSALVVVKFCPSRRVPFGKTIEGESPISLQSGRWVDIRPFIGQRIVDRAQIGLVLAEKVVLSAFHQHAAIRQHRRGEVQRRVIGRHRSQLLPRAIDIAASCYPESAPTSWGCCIHAPWPARRSAAQRYRFGIEVDVSGFAIFGRRKLRSRLRQAASVIPSILKLFICFPFGGFAAVPAAVLRGVSPPGGCARAGCRPLHTTNDSPPNGSLCDRRSQLRNCKNLSSVRIVRKTGAKRN